MSSAYNINNIVQRITMVASTHTEKLSRKQSGWKLSKLLFNFCNWLFSISSTLTSNDFFTSFSYYALHFNCSLSMAFFRNLFLFEKSAASCVAIYTSFCSRPWHFCAHLSQDIDLPCNNLTPSSLKYSSLLIDLLLVDPFEEKLDASSFEDCPEEWLEAVIISGGPEFCDYVFALVLCLGWPISQDSATLASAWIALDDDLRLGGMV